MAEATTKLPVEDRGDQEPRPRPPNGARSRACDGRSIACSTISSVGTGGRRSAAACSTSSRSGAASNALRQGAGGRHRRQATRLTRFPRSCREWTRAMSTSSSPTAPDDQGREEGGERGEQEGLLSVGAPLRLVRALVPRARWRRRRQDRGQLQERCAHGDAAEDSRGAEEREEDRHQEGVRLLLCSSRGGASDARGPAALSRIRRRERARRERASRHEVSAHALRKQ